MRLLEALKHMQDFTGLHRNNYKNANEVSFMELKKDDKVRDLVDLFNSGKIKYQDIQDLFGVSRDLIKSRLTSIGLSYDNKAKKMDGEATEADLNIPLFQLFEKQRGRNQLSELQKGNREVAVTKEKSPKVSDNPTIQLSNKTDSKQENKPTNKQINKQDGNPTNKPSFKKVTYEIEEQLHDELRIKAIREKRTVSEIVNEIIKRGLI